jgi:hypothetical protein
MRSLRIRLTAVLATAAVTALTVGAAGASAQAPVPTQQPSETPAQYVQRLASMGYTGWLIPTDSAARKR